MAATLVQDWARGGRHPLQIKGSPGDRVQSAVVAAQFDASYPTGGETIDALTNLFKKILYVFATPVWDSGSSKFVSAWWNAATSKLQLIDLSDGTQIDDAADMSAVLIPLFVIGQE